MNLRTVHTQSCKDNVSCARLMHSVRPCSALVKGAKQACVPTPSRSFTPVGANQRCTRFVRPVVQLEAPATVEDERKILADVKVAVFSSQQVNMQAIAGG